jgi:NADPH:quinone reductase
VRAVGFFRFGGPEVLEVVELPEPEPGPGELRVRVAAATVNPTDLLFRSGGRAVDLSSVSPPYVPGMELAGTVDMVGKGVERRQGETVIAITATPPNGPGAQAELVVVPAESAAPAPAGWSLTAATTLPMNGLSARQALDLLDLAPGMTVAVSGAAGAVGGFTVQLAVAAGLRVVAVARARDEELVRSLGAQVFIAAGEDPAAAVRDAVPGGVDAVIDCALLGAAMLPAVRDGGQVAVMRSLSGNPDRGIQVHQVAVSRYLREGGKLAELSRQAEGGELALRVAETIPPEGAAAAHRRLEAGVVRGRIVIAFPPG